MKTKHVSTGIYTNICIHGKSIKTLKIYSYYVHLFITFKFYSLPVTPKRLSRIRFIYFYLAPCGPQKCMARQQGILTFNVMLLRNIYIVFKDKIDP